MDRLAYIFIAAKELAKLQVKASSKATYYEASGHDGVKRVAKIETVVHP